MPKTLRALRVFGTNYRSWPSLDWRLDEGGVKLVRGRDLQSRTTSGVGKSSLLASISCALGCGPPATATRTWGADHTEVGLHFAIDEEGWRAKRGSPFSLKQEGWPEADALKGKLAEEKLRSMVGHPQILRALTWRPQAQRGHFFSKSAAERRDFLAEVLSIVSYEQQAEAARKAAEKAKGQLQVLAEQRQRAEQRLSSAKAKVADSLRPLEQADLAALAEEAGRMGRVVELLEGWAKEDSEAHLAWLRDKAELGAKVGALDGIVAKLEAAARQWQTKIAVARGRCPTCGTGLAPSSEVASLEANAAKSARDLEEARSIRARFGAPVPAPSFKTHPQEVAEAKQASHQAATALNAAKNAAAARAASLAAAEEGLAAAQAEVAALESQRARLAAQQAEEADLASWERAWQANFAAQMLADLSAATNAILAQVPNVGCVTVSFEPRETASGRQEVADRVFVAGVEREDGLSIGQRSGVELASDLALRDVVGARGQMRPAWMVLDEPFEGMGLPDREAFLDWMQAHGDLFMVVDQHSREFSELFERSGIGVEMSNGVSRIVSQEERAGW